MTFDYNDIDALIGKDLAGEISAKEKIILIRWIESSADNKSHYEHFKTLFDKSLDLKHSEVYDTDAAWEILKDKIRNRNQIRNTIRFSWRIAAAVAIFLTAGFIIYQKLLTPQHETELSARAAVSENTLPDGTRVFMNKNTFVEYSYEPISKVRKTKLKGEAYFKIAEKTNQEFLIEVNGLLIKDIGTAFNVKAYPESDSIEVYVESGEVMFYSTTDSGLRLKENETGIYSKALGTFLKRTGSDDNILAYKTQIFVFDNARLNEVIEAINEVYDTKLRLEKKELENCRITVTFRHETIDMITEVIAETLSLTFEKNENEIILKGNGCAQ